MPTTIVVIWSTRIVAMPITIVKIFSKNFLIIININRWLKDGVSLGFLDLNPIFHNIVAILLG